jgi:pyruvate formate lyase activating enzyme
MDMIDWKRKFTSRKLWMAVVAFVTPLLLAFGLAENEVTQIAAIIMAGADVLAYILAEGLVDYAAMDIKNAPAKYAETAGLTTALPLVERSVELLKKSGIAYEFRTTVTGNLHEPADFEAIGKWISGAERYFLQPFLDSGEVLKQDAGYPVSREKLQACLETVRKYVPQAAVRGAA